MSAATYTEVLLRRQFEALEGTLRGMQRTAAAAAGLSDDARRSIDVALASVVGQRATFEVAQAMRGEVA